MDGNASSQPPGHAMRVSSLDPRARSEESWVEISSRPSSSSLSSAADEVVTTGLRIEQQAASRRRRSLRPNAPPSLQVTQQASNGEGSSQEEYDESESESDRIMTSSNEGAQAIPTHLLLEPILSPALQSTASDDDDDHENRTAINYPIRNDQCFTPQPNAFSHPPSTTAMRHGSVPVTGSYFPSARSRARPSLSSYRSLPNPSDARQSHAPHNILSPSYNAAAHHDEVLRSSLSTLLSCAAAARGLPKADQKHPATTSTAPPRAANRIEPGSFRLVTESALPTAATAATAATARPAQARPSQPPTTRQSPQAAAKLEEPTFHPTLSRRGTSTSTGTTTSSSANKDPANPKRKYPSNRPATTRDERRALKRARRSASSSSSSSSTAWSTDELIVTPTLMTWLVSAGVVVALSALSFHAGYSLGREAGRLEGSVGFSGAGGGWRGGGLVSGAAGGGEVGFGGSCARETAAHAGRGLGLKRSLARGAVQV